MMFLGRGEEFLCQRRRWMCRGSKWGIDGRMWFVVGRESSPFFHLYKLVKVVLKFQGWINPGYHFDVDSRGYEIEIVGGIGVWFVGMYVVCVEESVTIVERSLRTYLEGLFELVLEFLESLETKPGPAIRLLMEGSTMRDRIPRKAVIDIIMSASLM
jgi:hypothetical protein